MEEVRLEFDLTEQYWNRLYQKYSRLRCFLHFKGLVICFYLGWTGSILQIRTNIIKVGSKSWLLKDLCIKKDKTFRVGYFTTISGIYIFHKIEIQIIILRCLTSLNSNWKRTYNINHNFSVDCFFNFVRKNKIKLKFQKLPFFNHFWSFFWLLHKYLSQNWDSDRHLRCLMCINLKLQHNIG
jgi:hypothetical protein